jgi:hypothetical protein
VAIDVGKRDISSPVEVVTGDVGQTVAVSAGLATNLKKNTGCALRLWDGTSTMMVLKSIFPTMTPVVPVIDAAM